MKSAAKVSMFGLIAALGLSAYGQAFACTMDGKEGFLPQNNFYIPAQSVGLDHSGNPTEGISEKDFNDVINAVYNTYAPIAKAMGGNLVIAQRNWNDGTVNAYADREDGNWNLNFFGGLARAKEMTKDAFLAVVCHELGHQIGGAPKFTGDQDNSWAGVEGQADYFSTVKCTRRVLAHTNNFRPLAALDAPDAVRLACQNSFKNDNDAALCIRTSMGGLALAQLLADLGGEAAPDFSTPDKSVVATTFEEHPAAQCRLDTYYAAAICPVPYTVDVDQKDPTIGTCSQEKGATFGYRPRCWYAPQQDNRTMSNVDPHSAYRGHYY